MLHDVGSNLKTVKFFLQHFRCCMILYSFGHVHATLLHKGMSARSTCYFKAPEAQKHRHVALKMVRAFGQPVMSQHHATMLQSCNVARCMFKVVLLLLMHDVNNNKTPLNILKFFQKLSVVHSYNTRSSISGKFYVQSSRLEIRKRSFSRFGRKLWNEIPQRAYVLELYRGNLTKETFVESFLKYC